jgi:hypothetical protein
MLLSSFFLNTISSHFIPFYFIPFHSVPCHFISLIYLFIPYRYFISYSSSIQFNIIVSHIYFFLSYFSFSFSLFFLYFHSVFSSQLITYHSFLIGNILVYVIKVKWSMFGFANPLVLVNKALISQHWLYSDYYTQLTSIYYDNPYRIHSHSSPSILEKRNCYTSSNYCNQSRYLIYQKVTSKCNIWSFFYHSISHIVKYYILQHIFTTQEN